MGQLILWGGLAVIAGLFVWLVVYLPTWLRNRQVTKVATLGRSNRKLRDANEKLRKTLGEAFTTLQFVSGASENDRVLIESVRDKISTTMLDTHNDTLAE